MKELKFSKFIIVDEDQNITLINTFTGAIVDIQEEDEKNRFKKLYNTNEKIYFDNSEFIETLYKLGFLVDTNIDETERAIKMYDEKINKSKVLELILLVTRQCNFRCVYCYEKHENKSMTIETYENILKYISTEVSKGIIKEISIVLFGGEPLLEYENIIYFLDKLNNKIIGPNNLKLVVSASTNGYLLSLDKFKKLYSLGFRYAQITLDGNENKHDQCRPLVGGQRTWHKIIENLKDIQENIITDFKISIRTNFDNETLQTQQEFLDYISNTFDNRFSVYFEPIKKLGGENDSKLKVVNEITEIIGTIEMIDFAKNNKLDLFTHERMYSPLGRVCYAGRSNNLLIDWDGKIKKCTLALDAELNCVGELLNNGTILFNENMRRWCEIKIERSSKCYDCNLLPLCFKKKCPKNMLIDDVMKLNCIKEEIYAVETFKHKKL